MLLFQHFIHTPFCFLRLFETTKIGCILALWIWRIFLEVEPVFGLRAFADRESAGRALAERLAVLDLKEGGCVKKPFVAPTIEEEASLADVTLMSVTSTVPLPGLPT